MDELLKQSELISIHVPKNSVILTEREFNLFGAGKILINTSLGLTFEKSSFLKWMQIPGNFSIFDGDGIGQFKQEFGDYERIIQAMLRQVGRWKQKSG